MRARSVAKINDPVRAEAYAELGVATVCRTTLMADAILEFTGLDTVGQPGVRAPSGSHHEAGAHVGETAAAAGRGDSTARGL